MSDVAGFPSAVVGMPIATTVYAWPSCRLCPMTRSRLDRCPWRWRSRLCGSVWLRADLSRLCQFLGK